MSLRMVGLVALVAVGVVVTLAVVKRPRPQIPETPAAPGPSASVTPLSTDPVVLVGLWEVRDAAEEESGAVLRLAVAGHTGELSLFRRCGAIGGAWDAGHHGELLVDRSGWSGACGADPWPEWLASAATYRPRGTGHLLLDATGGVVARLVPGEEPTLPPTVAQSLAAPPEVTAETRAALARPAPLPDDVRPADERSLSVRWVPVDAPRGSQAHVRFHDDGTWTASDGCNGHAGRWRLAADGALLTASSGISTLIGCENIDVAPRLAAAGRAAFDADSLVLFDREGTQVGRFRRAG